MNLLHIESSILGQASASRDLSAAIVALLRREVPQAKVTIATLLPSRFRTCPRGLAGGR